MLQSNENRVSEVFSSVFICCIFTYLAGRGSVLPVEKTLHC
jgi:hypothetical protein